MACTRLQPDECRLLSSTYLERAEWRSLRLGREQALRESIAFGDGKSPEAVMALSARPTKLLICAMKEKAEAFDNAWRLPIPL
jgi:hypothetical protein